MQRALRWPHVKSLGLIGEVPQARLPHDVCKQHEHGLIGTENFAYQHEAQSGHMRMITLVS